LLSRRKADVSLHRDNGVRRQEIPDPPEKLLRRKWPRLAPQPRLKNATAFAPRLVHGGVPCREPEAVARPGERAQRIGQLREESSRVADDADHWRNVLPDRRRFRVGMDYTRARCQFRAKTKPPVEPCAGHDHDIGLALNPPTHLVRTKRIVSRTVNAP